MTTNVFAFEHEGLIHLVNAICRVHLRRWSKLHGNVTFTCIATPQLRCCNKARQINCMRNVASGVPHPANLAACGENDLLIVVGTIYKCKDVAETLQQALAPF